MIDSVFDPLTTERFATDRAIIPKATIKKELGKIEKNALEDMADLFDVEVDRLVNAAQRALDNRDMVAIASLDWGLAPQLQKIFLRMWEYGWALGEDQGIQAQKKVIPKRLKDESPRFSKYQTPDVMAAIRQILTLVPIGLRNTPAERAVLRRLITLAGDFSSDALNRLKRDLIDSMQPQPDTGEPLPRPKLLERIQETLSVTKSRAEAIARTETTNAYNQGRLETYNRSQLVTHVRFLAISDNRTTDICRSRNGMIIPVSDAGAVASNTPPLHVNCRSVLSPLMPSVSKSHAAMVADPSRDYANRSLAPLPNGWG